VIVHDHSLANTLASMALIRTATPVDAERAARTYARAFVDDPVVRWLIPDDEEYETQHQRFFGGLVRRWTAGGTLWCTDDVVAVAGWNPPGRPDVEVDMTGLEMEHPTWRLERFAALREQLQANTPPEQHWHLNMIGTHPDWQRQGLAGELMAVLFDVADAAGLPCYLETETPENVAYYRHHGFEVRSEWDVATAAGTGPHMWGMLRPAR
jgi:ribosomal protein S18 acetylase RimI-like enzyme